MFSSWWPHHTLQSHNRLNIGFTVGFLTDLSEKYDLELLIHFKDSSVLSLDVKRGNNNGES